MAVDAHRTVQLVEHVGAEGAVVAEALDAEQASVGGEADLLQIFKVPQPAADIEVVRVVDHRLGAQRAPFLVVLLDARVLVVDVQRRGNPVGDDAGAIPRGGASVDAPIEDRAACETPGAGGLAQSSILLVNTHSPWIADWMPAPEDRRHAERWK